MISAFILTQQLRKKTLCNPHYNSILSIPKQIDMEKLVFRLKGLNNEYFLNAITKTNTTIPHHNEY